MGKKTKAHLLYMTGLSVDKNRMNNITENINFDKDYTYWLRILQEEFNLIINEKNKLLKKIKNSSEKVTKKHLDFNIDLVDDNNTIIDMVDDTLNEKKEGFVSNGINALSSTVFKTLGYRDDIFLQNNFNNLYKLIKNYKNKEVMYQNGDFFSLYLSNQSDSIGIEPLAKISKNKNFTMEHAYCDWDYYDNKYIDHVVLEVKKNQLTEKIEELIEQTFKIHIYDILFSKIIKENKIEIEETQGNKQLISFADMILKGNEKYSKEDIINTLSDRNFFGVSLLSQIFYTLQKNIVNKKFDISIEETTIAEKQFLHELLEMATDTKTQIKQNEKNSVVRAKIYFSNGIELSKSSKELAKDEFFKYTNQFENKNILVNESDITKVEQQIQYWAKKTVDFDRNQHNLVEYIFTPHESYEYLYIKVPIKIMISLPLDENEKPSSDIYLPSCLIEKQEKVIDVLTVGGAEHNRALSHLINKHRMKYKSDRLFGFMDNYYDFEHKRELDNPKNNDAHNNSFNFFMGLNQPVSGWNYLLSRREDDADGNSINSDVKFITFKLKDKKQKINVVSIYGFSAIASVLGINMFIEEIRNNNPKVKNGIFSAKFTKFFDQSKILDSRGTTATLFFYKTLKDVINNKKHSKSLYRNMQIILQNFSNEDKKLLIDKLGKVVKKLIVNKNSINSNKYILEIDYEKIKNNLDNLTLSDIKLGQIKSVVRFFFDNKCYLNVFNNNSKKYSKILYYSDEKNHLLISNIQRGRVSTRN